jgi:hypothetical protein
MQFLLKFFVLFTAALAASLLSAHSSRDSDPTHVAILHLMGSDREVATAAADKLSRMAVGGAAIDQNWPEILQALHHSDPFVIEAILVFLTTKSAREAELLARYLEIFAADYSEQIRAYALQAYVRQSEDADRFSMLRRGMQDSSRVVRDKVREMVLLTTYFNKVDRAVMRSFLEVFERAASDAQETILEILVRKSSISQAYLPEIVWASDMARSEWVARFEAIVRETKTVKNWASITKSVSELKIKTPRGVKVRAQVMARVNNRGCGPGFVENP